MRQCRAIVLYATGGCAVLLPTILLHHSFCFRSSRTAGSARRYSRQLITLSWCTPLRVCDSGHWSSLLPWLGLHRPKGKGKGKGAQAQPLRLDPEGGGEDQHQYIGPLHDIQTSQQASSNRLTSGTSKREAPTSQGKEARPSDIQPRGRRSKGGALQRVKTETSGGAVILGLVHTSNFGTSLSIVKTTERLSPWEAR